MTAIFIATGLQLVISRSAYAQLDPGSGSFAFQTFFVFVPFILWLWALIDVLSEFSGSKKMYGFLR